MRFRHRLESGVAAAHDLGLRTSAPLECVPDQLRNVRFILDDEHAMLLHVVAFTLQRPGFGQVSKLLNLGYECTTAPCYPAPELADEPLKSSVTRIVTRLLVVGAVLLLALAWARPSVAQEWISYNSDPGNILEGNWQSCQQQDGRYAEKIYDHYVNSVPQFEVHLGPRREFAIFKGVQEDHREHEAKENLLKPYRVLMEGSRARQHWDIPSLNLSFTVTLGGGSTMDCESWYILLSPLGKSSH